MEEKDKAVTEETPETKKPEAEAAKEDGAEPEFDPAQNEPVLVYGPPAWFRSGEEKSEEAEGKEADEMPEAEKPQEKPEKEKKKFFGKSDKTEKALEKAEKSLKEAEDKLAEATDRIQRQMAEFDNFRKRSEKEKNAQFEIGARSVLERLLPIVDSFERGLGGLDEEKAGEPFAQGMSQVYKQLQKMMEELQVEAIPAVGQPFDANLHNAVMHVEDPDQPENTVVEEFQKGYTYRGTVIRYSMVKVAN